jgi:hypothetical protein
VHITGEHRPKEGETKRGENRMAAKKGTKKLKKSKKLPSTKTLTQFMKY